MSTVAQQLAESDYRNFYLEVHGEAPAWMSGTDAAIADSCDVGRIDFLNAFLTLHPRHETHRKFLELAMTQLHAFSVSRAAWRRVVGNETALPARPQPQELAPWDSDLPPLLDDSPDRRRAAS